MDGQTLAGILGAIATVVAAIIAAFLSWRTLLTTRVQGNREQGFARYKAAIDNLYSGDPARAANGVAILDNLRTSEWLNDDDRMLVVEAIRAYRARTGGGGT